MARKKTGKKRKMSAAFKKFVTAKHDIDDVLEAIVGRGPISRPQVTKKIWAYIKRRPGVQEGRLIHICEDENLQALAPRKDTITMFELTKLVNKHIL